MPHLLIEYSSGTARRIDIGEVCGVFHEFLQNSLLFPTAGIRVKAYEATFALVGDGLAQNDFMTLTLAVGAGRDMHVLKDEGEALFQLAQAQLAPLLAEPYFSLSLEIREINPDLSWKDTPIYDRLRADSQGSK